MWSTMFAFQRWHSAVEMRRYLRRFMHLMPGFNRLEGILRTPLNQYDSLVRPLVNWLREQGVDLQTGTQVQHALFDTGEPPALVTGLQARSGDSVRNLVVNEQDRVLVTLGSMTEQAVFGSMTRGSAPAGMRSGRGRLGALARHSGAQRRRSVGRSVFCGDVPAFDLAFVHRHADRSRVLCTFMERFTGNSAGTGGLVTFRNSRWLLSVVLAPSATLCRPAGRHQRVLGLRTVLRPAR
jgi:oleate hydratase